MASWTVAVPLNKLAKILSQLDMVMKLKKVRLNDLQYLVGRLLWLTSEWHHLRPLLIPLYRATVCIPVTMVGVDHVTYHEMWQSLDDKLRRATDLSHRHKTLVCHTQVVRVANTNVSSLTALRNVHIKSWRVWLGVQDPSSPWRELDDASSCALQDWRDVFHFYSVFIVSAAPAAS